MIERVSSLEKTLQIYTINKQYDYKIETFPEQSFNSAITVINQKRRFRQSPIRHQVANYRSRDPERQINGARRFAPSGRPQGEGEGAARSAGERRGARARSDSERERLFGVARPRNRGRPYSKHKTIFEEADAQAGRPPKRRERRRSDQSANGAITVIRSSGRGGELRGAPRARRAAALHSKLTSLAEEAAARRIRSIQRALFSREITSRPFTALEVILAGNNARCDANEAVVLITRKCDLERRLSRLLGCSTQKGTQPLSVCARLA